jgi:hypothetical protein
MNGSNIQLLYVRLFAHHFPQSREGVACNFQFERHVITPSMAGPNGRNNLNDPTFPNQYGTTDPIFTKM